jgi:hypothetical protein
MSEEHRCGSRESNPQADHAFPGPDKWDTLPNGDRVCSFCGSMHPDDYLAFLEKIPETPGSYVSWATGKNYKIYLRRPGIKNASEGAIKFYTWHAGDEGFRVKLREAHNAVADLCVRRIQEEVASFPR